MPPFWFREFSRFVFFVFQKGDAAIQKLQRNTWPVNLKVSSVLSSSDKSFHKIRSKQQLTSMNSSSDTNELLFKVFGQIVGGRKSAQKRWKFMQMSSRIY